MFGTIKISFEQAFLFGLSEVNQYEYWTTFQHTVSDNSIIERTMNFESKKLLLACETRLFGWKGLPIKN